MCLSQDEVRFYVKSFFGHLLNLNQTGYLVFDMIQKELAFEK